MALGSINRATCRHRYSARRPPSRPLVQRAGSEVQMTCTSSARGCAVRRLHARVGLDTTHDAACDGKRERYSCRMGSVFGQTGTVGAAALLVACGGGAPQVESGQVTAAVIDGTPSPAEHDAVLLLHVEGQNGIFNDCTATLISPRIVVTAKHCVSLVQPGDFVCRGNGELVQDGTGAGIFGQVVDPASIAFYVGTTPSSAPASHGMQVVATGSPDACHDDIAMVVLDQPIAVTRLVALRRSITTRVGEAVTLVGYGMGDLAGGIVRRELADVRILDVGAADAASADSSATTPPRTFVVPGATVCYGDSGGPALSSETGALVGTYSRITGDCYAVESRNTYMLASGYGALVEDALAITGEAVAVEPGTGQAGSAPAGGGASHAGGQAGSIPFASAASAPAERGAFKCATGHGRRGPASGWLSSVALVAVLWLKRWSRCRGACAGERCRTVRAD